MSKKNKWFTPKPREWSLRAVPSQRLTADSLLALWAVFTTKGADDSTVKLLKGRASMEPRRRLAVNLKSLLDTLSERDVENVLPGGLSESEKKALSDVQLRNYPTESLAAAHSLLNVAERDAVLQTVRALLKDIQLRDDAVADHSVAL